MSTDQSSTNTADDYLYTIKRISDDVYCIVENDQFNWNPLLYFICTSGKALLIDTGCGSGDLKNFLISAGLLGISQKLVVVNTHNHPQQTGGAYLFSTTGTYGLSRNVECLCASDANPKYTELRDTNFDWQVHSYKVTKWLAHNEMLTLNEETGKESYVQIFHTPGHTPDSLSLWYQDGKRLFVGDLFYRTFLLVETICQCKIGLFHKQNLLKIRYSSSRSEADGQCLPNLKNYHRFLLSVVAGTHYKLPLEVPSLHCIRYETRNK
ncbi:unnamed protein product, partial [Enterobius vermicularis]|uniref:Lactamase_B domain-containing protein n=1 Tax=Enterobius vermicularis TaxID=51028 RepID=A0A0N4VB84_ENTVE